MYFSIVVKAGGIAVLLVAAGAWAQSFPSKPFRVVVPFTPGSASDNSATRGVAPIAARSLRLTASAL